MGGLQLFPLFCEKSKFLNSPKKLSVEMSEVRHRDLSTERDCPDPVSASVGSACVTSNGWIRI